MKECEYCKEPFILPKYYQQKRFCSNSCRGKWQYKEGNNLPPLQYGLIPWNKGTKGIMPSHVGFQKGSKNPSWNGGSSSFKDNHKREWKEWREAIFKRDNWTCKECGIRNVKLHPDHIKCFAHNPKLRFNIGNGRTLCIPCHKKTKTYGFHRCN